MYMEKTELAVECLNCGHPKDSHIGLKEYNEEVDNFPLEASYCDNNDCNCEKFSI